MEDLKAIALSTFGLESVSEGGRLRIDDQTLGLRHPCKNSFIPSICLLFQVKFDKK